MHEAHRGFRVEQGLPWPAAVQGDGISLQDATDCALCCFIIHLQAVKFYFIKIFYFGCCYTGISQLLS